MSQPRFNQSRFLIPVVTGIAVLAILIATHEDSSEDMPAADVKQQALDTSGADKAAELAAAKAASQEAKAQKEKAALKDKAKAQAATEAAESAAKAEAEIAKRKAEAESKAAELAAQAQAKADESAAKAEAEAAKLAAAAKAKAAESAAKAKADAAKRAAQAEAKTAEVVAAKAKADAAALAAKAANKDSSAGESSDPQYVVENGMVDKSTFNGYRRFHGTCHACHGQDAAGGSFAPSLVESLKTIDYALFRKTVVEGRLVSSSSGAASVMPAFSNDPNVMKHLDDIYRYLAARSDGVLGTGRPKKIPK